MWLHWQLDQTSLERSSTRKFKKNVYGYKKSSNKFQHIDKPVNYYNKKILTTSKEQLRRLIEDFGELLNRPTQETPLYIQPVETDKPTKREIRRRIITHKNGKGTVPIEIPAEAIKAYTETAVIILHNLFTKIWEPFSNNKKKAPLLSYQRKEIWGTAITTWELCSCQCLTSAWSSLRRRKRQWTQSSGTSRLF